MAREDLRALQTETADVVMTAGVHDEWSSIWNNNKFTSENYYLHCFRVVQVDAAFGWIWSSKCNNKWKFFAWLLLADMLNTRNMLKRRNFVIQDNNYGCLLCPASHEETVEHLFFLCPFSKTCWDKLGIDWPVEGNRLDMMHRGKESWLEPMFMEVFSVGAWGIWKERNNKHFRGIPPSVHSWTLRFKEDFDLLRHRSKTELGPFITHLVNSL